jgi:hypothetical protein
MDFVRQGKQKTAAMRPQRSAAESHYVARFDFALAPIA